MKKVGRLNLELHDKVAIVTGSSRGLGLASARALLEEGCRVTICARGEERLAERRRRTAVSSAVTSTAYCLSRPTSRPRRALRRSSRRPSRRFGGLDILVNNVGLARGSTIVDTTDAEWQEAFDQTLFPAIRASRLAVPHHAAPRRRLDRDDCVDLGPRIGRPDDLQRRQGGRDQPGEGDGAAAGARQHPRQQRGARLDSVSGGSWDRRQQEDPAGIAEFVSRELPFGRFGRPEEVGAVVAFLVSPRASWISGASVPVDGCQSRSLI